MGGWVLVETIAHHALHLGQVLVLDWLLVHCGKLNFFLAKEVACEAELGIV